MNIKKKIIAAIICVSLIVLNVMPVYASDGTGGGGISIGLSIVIALIVAGIACFIASSSMKSVHTATSAKRYEKQGSFSLSNKIDNHVNTTRQTIHHERSNS